MRSSGRQYRLLPWIIGSWLIGLGWGNPGLWAGSTATLGLVKAKTERQVVLEAMQRRPQDPWPRGEGHVVLGLPGGAENLKAYHEPGGGFSPSLGSFGISLWIRNAQGGIRVNSDEVAMDKVQQRLVWSNEREIPGILTETPDYDAAWLGNGNGRWILNLTAKGGDGERLAVVVRSVGPAGGPIQRLEWDGRRLWVNRRWTIICEPASTNVWIGHEGDANWTTATSEAREWSGLDGWGAARFELSGKRVWQLVVQDAAAATAGLRFSRTQAVPVLNLPDAGFKACLESQVAHLLMGLVGGEARPADPCPYPYSWLREGSLVVAALAQAGLTDTARQLARSLAEVDFRGGAGSEADGPALSLWALEELAVRLKDPQFDAWLWPSVQRKAWTLVRMLRADGALRRPLTSPLLPKNVGSPNMDLVCEASRGGLIQGRIGEGIKVLYVNAVAYRGLLSAVELAERFTSYGDAEDWRAAAREIKQAWSLAMRSVAADDNWAFTRGLWPAQMVAVADRGEYVRLLQARANFRNNGEDLPALDAPWTGLVAAEAHQWLAADQVERTWLNLRWFWRNQSSPGLYSWSQGKVSEDGFPRWNNIRGWLKPTQMTPAYGTAAEVLLLQLDMLAMVDQSDAQPVVIIGAGVPREWLSRPMAVNGLSTRLGWVDWAWRNNQMHVVFRGPRYPVRLGASFPNRTPVIIH